MSKTRQKRVAVLVHQIISEALTYKSRNSLFTYVTVSEVKMSPDLKHAKLFVSVQADDDTKQKTMAALRNATGFLRHQIAGQAQLKHLPEIEVIYDNSLDRADRIDQILRSLK